MHRVDRIDLGLAVPALAPAESSFLLAVSPGSWTLLQLRSTGQLVKRSLQVGSTTYSADVPVRASVTVASAPTLSALLEAQPTASEQDTWTPDPHWQAKADIAHLRDSQLAAPWIEALRTSLLAAAFSAADLPDLTACSSCEGLGQYISTDCSCALPASRHLGLVAGPDELVLDEPDAADQGDYTEMFDPTCPSCSGTGTQKLSCPPCQGSGQVPAAPTLLVTGPLGAFSTRPELAALLRSGLARVEGSFSSGWRFVDLYVKVDFTNWFLEISNQAAGLDSTRVRRGPYVYEWPDWLHASTSFRMRMRSVGEQDSLLSSQVLSLEDGPFEMCAGFDESAPWLPARLSGQLLPSGRSLLATLQDQLTRQLSSLSQPGPSGWFVEAEAMPAVPDDLLLTQLVDAADRYGASIGLGYGFIATGEFGPQVLLLDGNLTPLAQLGLGYTWAEALAQARLSVDTVLERARDHGLLG